MAVTYKSQNSSYWQRLDSDHHIHPFTDTGKLNAQGSRVITHADGIYLWDADGRKLLDGMAGLWCVNVGYGRQELIDAATAQMQKLPYYNTFFQCTNPPATELAEFISELTPKGMNHVFYTNSGSEANDTIVRMARHYWATRGQTEKQIIISRKNAYHGSTVAAASLGGMDPMHAQGGLPIPNIEHIAQPNWFASDRELDRDAFGIAAAQELETRINAIGEQKIAAFIAEPIQGAGGVIVPPATYWPEVKRICDTYDILLIADEVICGFGRLGTWFGSDYYGLQPDLMTIAKGLSSGYMPIGGVVVRDTIADVLSNQGGEFQHGFTYSGHPTACATAIANLRLLRDTGIVNNVHNYLAPYLQQCWDTLIDHPLVAETRGAGLLGALEIDVDRTPNVIENRQRKKGDCGLICRALALEHGLVMRSVEDAMVISPPLVITIEEIDILMARVRAVLDDAADQLLVR